MFTGIIKDVGQIVSVDLDNGDLRLGIKTKLSLKKCQIGDSICCSGICLTVIDIKNNIFYVELSKETLSITLANKWRKDRSINLEFSLKMGEKIGGHIVTGHVDGVSELVKIIKIKGSYKLDFKVSKELMKYIVKKGSISIDGVSLTINSTKDNIFSVNIISHTFKETTIGAIGLHDKVNIEVDSIARYAIEFAENYMKRITNVK
tara:strand:+ start:2550 stop:3164 length:615 start_codon:yes stop_codon:yes gene_type:complete